MISEVLTHEEAWDRHRKGRCLSCNEKLGSPKLVSGKYSCPVLACDEKLTYYKKRDVFFCIEHDVTELLRVHEGYCNECGEVWSRERVSAHAENLPRGRVRDLREVLELPQLPNPRREPNPHSNVRTRGW